MPSINETPDFSLVDTEVLMDFNRRTLVDATGLHWVDAAHTVLKCGALFQELEPLGYVPFSTEDGADTEHGRLLWTKANAGDYGPIAPFVPLTIEQQRSQMQPMSPRVFWKAARSIGVTKEAVVAQINLITDEDAREDALIDLQEATFFERLNPTLIAMAEQQSITPEQLDALWLHFTS